MTFKSFNWPARIACSKAVAGGWIIELSQTLPVNNSENEQTL